MTFSNHLPIKALFAGLLISVISILASGRADAQGFYDSLGDSGQFILFLDPGHGGQDLGARGSSSRLEKHFTLKLATILKKRLSGDDRIAVRLSRSDDIDFGTIERINMANSVRANLFIGIHADGGRIPRSHAMKIFVWGRDEDMEAVEDVQSADMQLDRAKWSELHLKNEGKSLALGHAMEESLRELNRERGVDIVRTDKMLIGGLTMPAVIIEPVDLSNPEDEIKLQNMKHLDLLADAIIDAIYGYLRLEEHWER